MTFLFDNDFDFDVKNVFQYIPRIVVFKFRNTIVQLFATRKYVTIIVNISFSNYKTCNPLFKYKKYN